MTVKIGGSPLKNVPGVAGGKKAERKPAQEKLAPEKAAPSRGGFDTASVNANRLAVMPRMSALGGEDAKRVQSAAVETLLHDSAKELDDYFTKAYGFDAEA